MHNCVWLFIFLLNSVAYIIISNSLLLQTIKFEAYNNNEYYRVLSVALMFAFCLKCYSIDKICLRKI